MIKERATLWLFLVIIVYSFAHFIWYWQTPLGQSPVLDGQENLILASQIADGTLPDEPFYRAILYPALLASLPIHWMVLGFSLHILNAILVFQISRIIWKSKEAGLLSAALIGLNPVLLHFAADPLDITLSITLFLGAILSVAKGIQLPERSLRCFAASGALITIASLTRPHFFALLIPLVLISGLLFFVNRKSRISTAAFLLPVLAILLSFGTFQKIRSDSFRILPWQGAFNLWASNHPGANGLYYTQSLSFHYTSEHQNPARLESEELYRKETGQEPEINALNHFWRTKAVEEILEDPTAWLELMLFKSYALLNNEEQYNNKTYRFHKAHSPALRFNPIGWGILLVLATIAVPKLYKNQPSLLLILFCTIALYAAGVLLYMASARFRLPLVPILSILSGGTFFFIRDLIQKRRAEKALPSLILAVLAAAIGYSQFGGIRSEKTFVQDALLLADASAKLGRDKEAFDWSSYALELSPQRGDAKRLRLISYYNRIAFEEPTPSPTNWSQLESDLDSPLSDPIFEYVKGVALWNLSRQDEAKKTWLAAVENYGWQAQTSHSALLYTQAVEIPTKRLKEPLDPSVNYSQLLYVMNSTNSETHSTLPQLKERFAHLNTPKTSLSPFSKILPRVLPPPKELQPTH